MSTILARYRASLISGRSSDVVRVARWVHRSVVIASLFAVAAVLVAARFDIRVPNQTAALILLGGPALIFITTMAYGLVQLLFAPERIRHG